MRYRSELFGPDRILHIMKPEDLRESVCGIWIGAGTWETPQTAKFMPTCVVCSERFDTPLTDVQMRGSID